MRITMNTTFSESADYVLLIKTVGYHMYESNAWYEVGIRFGNIHNANEEVIEFSITVDNGMIAWGIFDALSNFKTSYHRVLLDIEEYELEFVRGLTRQGNVLVCSNTGRKLGVIQTKTKD